MYAWVADHPFVILPAALLLWFGWIIVSRLYLSPLAHVPGPKLAALTSWYACYYDVVCRRGGGYLPFKIRQLHEQYGPIIVYSPGKVHISDPDFLDQIYATRDRNVTQPGSPLAGTSMGGAEDFQTHRLRRGAVSPYFSPKAILAEGSRIKDKVKQVDSIIASNVGTGQPLNLSDLFFAFTNDLVRSFCFGSDNGLLSDLQEARKQRTNVTEFLFGINFSKHFSWMPKLLARVPFRVKATSPAVLDLLRFRADIMQDIKKILSDTNNDSKGLHSVFHEIRDSPILPTAEKAPTRLQDEATLMVLAGTESPQKALSIAAFYLLSKQEVLARVREELHSAQQETEGEIPLQTLLNLTYLNAVIQEVHRLSFGLTYPTQRYVPNDSLRYTATSGPYKGTQYIIPPRTSMSCVTLCTHTNESLFQNPWQYNPERWIAHTAEEEKEVNQRKRCMMALGKGHRKCIGMHLAQAAMCLVIERLVSYDMRLYETIEDDVKFIYDQQVSQARLGSNGVQAFVDKKL